MTILRFSLLLICCHLLASEPRIVAIGDVHGDLDALVSILRETELVDEDLTWSGGESILVQTGDLLDRGPDVKAIMDLMMRLEREAPEKGGEVVVLLGNHEIMNVLGLTRDVNPEAYANWVDDDSTKRRQKTYRELVRKNRNQARSLGFEWKVPPGFRAQWIEEKPLGYLEYVADMGPEGTYGRWLREKDAMTLIDGTIFVHAGIPPEMATMPIEEINRQIKKDIERADTWHRLLVAYEIGMPHFTASAMISAARSYLRGERKYGDLAEGGNPDATKLNLAEELDRFIAFRYGSLLGEESPLWFRGLVVEEEEAVDDHLEAILETNLAKRLVCGHTPQRSSIGSRFDARLFVIDTAMSSAYEGGRPSALVLHKGNCTAVYLEESAPICRTSDYFLLAPQNPIGPPTFPAREASDLPLGRRTLLARDGSPLPIQEDDEVIAFLREAKILEAKTFGSGSTKPLRMVMERDGVRMRAIFRYVDVSKQGLHRVKGRMRHGFHDQAIHEKAAYELDRLLGLGRVPPVVVRNYANKEGTIQLWIEEAMNEASRLEEKLDHPNILFNEHQRRIMLIFDALIYNFDRNQGNILYGPDWYLWFIDHTRSFRDDPLLLKDGENLFFCEKNLWEKLKTVSDDQIREALSPYLRRRQVNAVIKRRQMVVERLEELIEQRGERIVLYEVKLPE